MNIGSLCTGIGGLDLAAEWHYGGRLVWCADNDPAADIVLRRHWPDAVNVGDITDLDWACLSPVDVLTAGYPCQPFSQAGMKRGADDERHLWPYIFDAIWQLQPPTVVLENVVGHLGLGARDVAAELTGLGYCVRWGVVRASDAGAAHRRARWFCVATNADRGRPPQQLRHGPDAGLPVVSEHGGGTGGQPRPAVFGPYAAAVARWEGVVGCAAPHPTERGKGGRPRIAAAFMEWLMGFAAGHVTSTCHDGAQLQGDIFGGWHTDEGVARSSQLRLLGNAVVPQQAALALAWLDGAA